MSKLSHIFASVLGVEESAITPALSPDNTPAWDSLTAIILLTEIEKAYGVRFAYDEAMRVSTYGEAENLLRKKGLNPDA